MAGMTTGRRARPPRAHGLLLAAASVAAAAAAGCGGGGSTAAACDDRAYRAQDEELYVAIATAQNADVNPTPAAGGAVADLRRGLETLRSYLDRHPPCDERLQRLEGEERSALALLEEAAELLESGQDPGNRLGRAVTMLGAVEEELLRG